MKRNKPTPSLSTILLLSSCSILSVNSLAQDNPDQVDVLTATPYDDPFDFSPLPEPLVLWHDDDTASMDVDADYE